MATIPFTARIEKSLKAELDQIALYERRSAGFIANQAIRNFVEERMATREIIVTGLALIDAQVPGIASEQVHDWFMADEDAPFPKAPAAK